MLRHLLFVFLLLFCPVLAAEDAVQLYGPLLGHSTPTTAQVIVQTNAAGAAALEYWLLVRPAEVQRTEVTQLEAAQHYLAHFELADLTPGQTYGYRVLLDGRDISGARVLRVRTPPLWRWRTEPPGLSVVLGSCAYLNDPPNDRPGEPYGRGYEIFQSIAQNPPHLMLWLGDNLYLREADYTHPAGIAQRYRSTRALPELQTLLSATQHYAIWDDHDYGADDSSKSYVFKAASRAAFQRYWANPSYGLPETPGIFTQFSAHGIDFFLLDNRTYRDKDSGPDHLGKTQFGAAQMAWLQDALLASSAPFKIIAGGSQFLNPDSPYEGWQHFPEERTRFLDWLAEAKISGVLFLSGDRHHTVLLKRERPGNYPLHELTCSPLTAKAYVPTESGAEARVPETLVATQNYCRLDFTGPQQDRQLSISVHDAQGKLLWQRSLSAQTLVTAP